MTTTTTPAKPMPKVGDRGEIDRCRPLPVDQMLPGLEPPEMRAITVYQPWATLLAEGVKTVENRTRWPYRYRGLLAVHAATDASIDWAALNDPMVAEACGTTPAGQRLMDSRFPCGVFLAVAELVDVHTPAAGCCDSPYARPDAGAHLVLARPVKLTRPVAARGFQALWAPKLEQRITINDLLERP